MESRKCAMCNHTKAVEEFTDNKKCCTKCLERHKERRRENPIKLCKMCNCEVKQWGWIGHITTIKHKNNAKLYQEDEE